MLSIAHGGVSADVDNEDDCELEYSPLDPTAAVLQTAPPIVADATEKGTPNAAADTMIIGVAFDEAWCLRALGMRDLRVRMPGQSYSWLATRLGSNS